MLRSMRVSGIRRRYQLKLVSARIWCYMKSGFCTSVELLKAANKFFILKQSELKIIILLFIASYCRLNLTRNRLLTILSLDKNRVKVRTHSTNISTYTRLTDYLSYEIGNLVRSSRRMC